MSYWYLSHLKFGISLHIHREYGFIFAFIPHKRCYSSLWKTCWKTEQGLWKLLIFAHVQRVQLRFIIFGHVPAHVQSTLKLMPFTHGVLLLCVTLPSKKTCIGLSCNCGGCRWQNISRTNERTKYGLDLVSLISHVSIIWVGNPA